MEVALFYYIRRNQNIIQIDTLQDFSIDRNYIEEDYTYITYMHEKDKSKLVMEKKDYTNFIAGAVGGIISRTICAPLERLKTLYQTNYFLQYTKGQPSIYQAFRIIYKEDKFKAFFKGNGISIMKATPESAIRLYIFEKIKMNFQKRFGEKLSTSLLFLSGSLSGAIAICIVFPLEVLRIRIAASHKNTYNGIFDAIVRIYKEEKKFSNFYKGLEANLCGVIPNSGLNLMIYEILKRIFSGSSSSDNSTYLSIPMLMFIGGTSSFITSSILYPFQTIQSRIIMMNLQVSKKPRLVPTEEVLTSEKLSKETKNSGFKFKNDRFADYKFFKVINNTLISEGYKGFYKGYGPAMTKVVLGNAIGLSVYEKLRFILKGHISNEENI